MNCIGLFLLGEVKMGEKLIISYIQIEIGLYWICIEWHLLYCNR